MPSIVGDHWYGEARRHPAQPPPTRRARQPRFDSPALAAAAQLTRIVRRRPVCRVQAQARLATRTRGAVVPDPRGRTISMRYPQVTDRMKEAPIKALRAIFAGFGQVLLVADRARSRALEQDTAQDAEHQPPADQPVPAAAAQRPESKQPESKQPESKQPESKWRSLDETGNVRLLSDPDLADAGLAAAETTGSAGTAGSVAEAAPAEPDAAPAETDTAPPGAADALAETAAAAPETAAAAPEPDAEVSDSGIAAPEPHVVIPEAAGGPGRRPPGLLRPPSGRASNWPGPSGRLPGRTLPGPPPRQPVPRLPLPRRLDCRCATTTSSLSPRYAPGCAISTHPSFAFWWSMSGRTRPGMRS